MTDIFHLKTASEEIENSFGYQAYSVRNANPMDLIEARKPISCAARAFVLAVGLGQVLDNQQRVSFIYTQGVNNDDYPEASIPHAQVEIDNGKFEPYIVSPEYSDGYKTTTINVFQPSKMATAYGPVFEDPVEGLRTYCEGQPYLKIFDLSDIDRAHEILVNHDFEQRLQIAA